MDYRHKFAPFERDVVIFRETARDFAWTGCAIRSAVNETQNCRFSIPGHGATSISPVILGYFAIIALAAEKRIVCMMLSVEAGMD
jgi:hypothetical protein